MKRTALHRNKKPKSKLQRRKDAKNSSYWRRKADAAWSRAVQERDNRMCQVCGRVSPYKVEVHHIVAKGHYPHLRHDLINGVTLCVQCHKWDDTLSAHGTPELFHRWFEQKFPGRYSILVAMATRHDKADFRNAYIELMKGGDVRMLLS